MVARIRPFSETVEAGDVVGDTVTVGFDDVVGAMVVDVAGTIVVEVGATVVDELGIVVVVVDETVVVVEVGGVGTSNSMVWQPAVTEVRVPSETTPEPTEKPIPMTVKPRSSRTPCHAAGVPCHWDPPPGDVSGALSLST
jgi:hypothetical protein